MGQRARLERAKAVGDAGHKALADKFADANFPNSDDDDDALPLAVLKDEAYRTQSERLGFSYLS